MSFMHSILGLSGGRSRAKAAGALVVVVLGLAGCGVVPTENVVVDCSGVAVRLSDIATIKANTALTDEQKRQALRDMCITDEAVITVLLQ